ncbi:MAG: urea ABC transporter permease subunit UrtB [Magnetococcales bacterium]|nr:urea ABC transporter permease subunit UrtB [Magnetococcales bacterium]
MALVWMMTCSSVARALTTEELKPLADNDYSMKINAVEALAATGDPALEAIFKAMLEGRLFTRRADGGIVIGEQVAQRYRLIDPIDGKNVGEETDDALEKVKVNNKLRKVLRGALGGLTLMAPDRGQRIRAARAMLASPVIDQLPLLEKARDAEADPEVARWLGMARDAILLTGSDVASQRLEALARLEKEGGVQVGTLLGQVANQTSPGPFKQALSEASDRVRRHIERWGLLGNLFQGLSLGSVLLLAAVGLAITFGVMGVINMAHGELVMLGAYTIFVVQDLFRAVAPDLLDWSLLIGTPLAFLVAGGFGIAIERGIIRHLYGRPLETLLATWGLSLVLQQLVRSAYGPTNREVNTPSWMSGAIETSQGLIFTYNRIAIILFSLAVVLGLAFIVKRTTFGLRMRAVTQNRPMAASMGIRTGWVDAMTFGLGSGVAGLAGVALSQIDNVSPNLGQAYIIDSFMVVVFGGVGNLWGTVVGALSLGMANKFFEPVAGAVLAKILILLALILFIQKRPRGMFPLKGRAVEA